MIVHARILVVVGLGAALAQSGCGGDDDGGDAGGGIDGGSQSIDARGPSRMFVTSATFTGNLGGLAGADAICQGAATANGLGGTWHAWLSTSTVDAIDHVQDVAPWYLVDGTTLVFSSHAQLRGSPSVPILQDETGAVIDLKNTPASDTVVRTGTANGGVAGETCNDFTSSDANLNGTYGFIDLTSDWTAFADGQCSSSNPRLYCFEQ